MHKRLDLTQEELKAVLKYEPDTGNFIWISSKRNLHIGTIAGHVDKKGYVYIKVKRSQRHAARLAILYMTSNWPNDLVDHINGNKSDNRWANLRCVTNGENKQNIRSANKNNKTSKKLGVIKVGRKWGARIRVNGEAIWLGTHDSADAAGSAYIEAKRTLHPFGEIARQH